MKPTPILVAALLAGSVLHALAADPAPAGAAKPPPPPAEDARIISVANPTNAASKLDALFEDKVIAKGKGFTVKQSELDDAFGEFRAAFATRGQQIPDAQRPLIEYRLLDRIIASRLLSAMATAADKAEAQKRLDKAMSDTMTNFASPEAFEQQLKFSGMTLDGYKKKTLEQLVWQTVLDRNLRPKFTVTEDDVKKFYKDNPSKFEKPEMVRASHVLLSTLDTTQNPPVPLSDEGKAQKLALAKKVKERADKGEDFAALAKKFSEDPGSKDKGGEYTFPRGKMVKPFETAAFSLEPGKISDIVETPFGYHIIKLSEKIPAEMVPLDKVHDELKKGLESQQIQKLIPDFVEQLKKENNVEILVPKPEGLDGSPKA